MFTRTLRFGTYRTIVSKPENPLFEKITALVFNSTNWTTDGSRMFFSSSCPQDDFLGHKVSVAIERESPTPFV